jgi:hypothetical protein
MRSRQKLNPSLTESMPGADEAGGVKKPMNLLYSVRRAGQTAGNNFK